MVFILFLTLLTSVWGGECPDNGHYLGHCAKCLYNAQCPEDSFCCPYLKKCVRDGHDGCYTPIAGCSGCKENKPGYPDSCNNCENPEFPNQWVECPVEGLQKRKLQKALTTFAPLEQCLSEKVTLVASDVYPETEGEVICSNAEECVINGVESVQDCADLLLGKDCQRFFASKCIEDISIDFCVCAGGEASIEREGSFMYEHAEKVTSGGTPRELCVQNECNVVGGCLFQEEVGFSCETSGYTSASECEDRDAGTWCEPFVPVPDTTAKPTKKPTVKPTHAPDPPLSCPKGSTVVEYRGRTFGADIGGCGLSKCKDRFGHRANNIKQCKKACVLHPDCRSFSYSPRNGDQYWIGKRVCTLYKRVEGTRLWPAVDGSYTQLLCKLETRKQMKCPKHTHQVGFMGQFSGADIGGCGLQKCPDRMGVQADSAEACFQACQKNVKCRSFTYAPMNGDINWPGKRVCTFYEYTVPTRLWPAKSGDYTQIMCIIRKRASKVQKHVSCEGKFQFGIVAHSNDPEACAAEILKNPSLCKSGIFMHQKSYSYSWGCRCCDSTGWTPHPYWSMYKVDMHTPKLQSTKPMTSDEPDTNWIYVLVAAFTGSLIGIVFAFVYRNCRKGKHYGDINLDPTRLNDENIIVA